MNKLRDDILQLAGFINVDAKNSRGNRFARDTMIRLQKHAEATLFLHAKM